MLCFKLSFSSQRFQTNDFVNKNTNAFHCNLQPKEFLQVTAAKQFLKCLYHTKLKLHKSSTLWDLSWGEAKAVEII